VGRFSEQLWGDSPERDQAKLLFEFGDPGDQGAATSLTCSALNLGVMSFE